MKKRRSKISINHHSASALNLKYKKSKLKKLLDQKKQEVENIEAALYDKKYDLGFKIMCNRAQWQQVIICGIYTILFIFLIFALTYPNYQCV